MVIKLKNAGAHRSLLCDGPGIEGLVKGQIKPVLDSDVHQAQRTEAVIRAISVSLRGKEATCAALKKFKAIVSE